MRTAMLVVGSALFPLLIILSLYWGEPKLLGFYPSAHPFALVFGQLVAGDYIGKVTYIVIASAVTVLLFIYLSYVMWPPSVKDEAIYFWAIFLVILIFNGVYIAVSFEYGLKYQGANYVSVLVLWNALFAALIAGCLVAADANGNDVFRMGYRWGLLAWPLSVAFPWMGETF